MKFSWILSSVLAVSSLKAVSGTTSRVLVHIPFQLHKKEGFDHVQAEFGFEKYPTCGTIAANVYFYDANLCEPMEENSGKNNTFPTNTAFKPPFILLTSDHSNAQCSFVTQARHAQMAGAAALVLGHTTCRCSDKECTDQFGPGCQDTTPSLVNDGSAADVSIPSFLIYKTLAKNLQDKLQSNQNVLMELNWGLPEVGSDVPQHPVQYRLWTTAHDPGMDLETYENIRTVARAFSHKEARGIPRFSVVDGSRFKCNEQVDEDGPCDHLCSNHGRYCSVHGEDLSGFSIVRETLRRLCIWEHYNTTTPTSSPYWDYVVYHVEHCNEPHKFVDEDCLNAAYKTAQIDPHVVDTCMTETGDLAQDVPNKLLDTMLSKQSTSGVVALPTITVNHMPLEHTSSYNLFESICSHYWSTNPSATPEICMTCGACPNTIGCVEAGHCVSFSNNHHHDSPKKSSRSGHHFFRTFMWLTVISGMIGGAWYYYKQRQEMSGNGSGGLLDGYGYMQLQLNNDGR